MKKAEFFLLGAHKLLRETTRDTGNWDPWQTVGRAVNRDTNKQCAMEPRESSGSFLPGGNGKSVAHNTFPLSLLMLTYILFQDSAKS